MRKDRNCAPRNAARVLSIGFGTRTIATITRTVATILALTMLVSLPADQVRSFATHLRAPVVRRSTRRHNFVGQPEISAAQHVEKSASAPSSLVPIEIAEVSRLLSMPESNTQIPPARLLRHLKLGVSRRNNPDPLS